jgi:hypothetical protein
MVAWARRARKIHKNKCFLTNETTNLEVHLIYGAFDSENLRYDDLNSILLARDLHRGLHAYVGWHNLCTGTNLIQDLNECYESSPDPTRFPNFKQPFKALKEKNAKLLTLIN